MPIPFAAAGMAISSVAKKIPWQVWACAGLVVVIAGWGELRHYQGKKEVRAEWTSAIERGKAVVKDLQTNSGKVTERVITKWRTKVVTIHEKGDTIERLIPQYIPSNTCMLPGGFRVLHDAAATNTVPEPTAGVAAKPVSAQEVASITNFNYTLCHEERSKLDALWEWAQGQHKAYLELCKQPGVVCSKGS